MKDAETWIAKDAPSLGSLVHVTRDGQDVVIVPAGGGAFQKRTSMTSLTETHRPATPEELSSLHERYEEILVTGDWFPDGAPALPAWSNGSLWNGSPQPMFEKSVLEEAMRDGRLGEPSLRMVYDTALDAFAVLEANGDPVPALDDRQALVKALASDAHSVELTAVDGTEVQVDAYPGQQIDTPMGPRTVYAIGAYSWIWSKAEAPLPPSVSMGR